MKHKQNDLIITDDFFKELPKGTIVESPPLADECVKFCAEINRLNRENEELRVKCVEMERDRDSWQQYARQVDEMCRDLFGEPTRYIHKLLREARENE